MTADDGWAALGGAFLAGRHWPVAPLRVVEREIVEVRVPEVASFPERRAVPQDTAGQAVTEEPKTLRAVDAAERAAQGTRDPLLALAVRWLRARLRGFLGQRVLADLRDCVKALDALPPRERACCAVSAGSLKKQSRMNAAMSLSVLPAIGHRDSGSVSCDGPGLWSICQSPSTCESPVPTPATSRDQLR